MDIILFGIQGSGKGTQGKILAEKKGLTYFEMGQELRNIVAAGSPIGQKIRSTLEGGNLVDDDTVMELVSQFLQAHDPDQPILFDGIPRTPGQSAKLLDLLKQYGRDAYGLLIHLDTDAALKRLLLRARHDDDEATIRRRMANFENETLPVIQTFRDRKHLIEVNGCQAVDDVTAELFQKIDPVLHS